MLEALAIEMRSVDQTLPLFPDLVQESNQDACFWTFPTGGFELELTGEHVSLLLQNPIIRSCRVLLGIGMFEIR